MALREHGWHAESCVWTGHAASEYLTKSERARCTCGLSAALSPDAGPDAATPAAEEEEEEEEEER